MDQISTDANTPTPVPQQTDANQAKEHALSALLQQGLSLHRANRFDEAYRCYQQMLAIDPRDFDALQLSATLQRQIGNHGAAIVLFDQALQEDKANAAVFNNRGNALKDLRRFDEAIASYAEAIRIKPDYAEAFNNRGATLQELKRFDEALLNYTEAIRIKPDYANAYLNLAMVLLLLGEFAKGWQLHEWRLKKDDTKNGYYAGPQMAWRGQGSVSGRRLLIQCEQGFGDSIQFWRYLPMVVALGAEVIVQVQKPLLSLFSTCKLPVTLVSKDDPLPEFDAHCPLMSLPLVFNTMPETIPAGTPYLFADAMKTAAWEKGLGAKGHLRVGLVWSGATGHKNDSNRSIQLAHLLPLLDLPVEWHSLQKEYRSADKQVMDSQTCIQQHQNELEDFSDTAALIDAMDIIISVDTSVAHLAAAMDKQVWILLPHVPDFRWLLNREDSPWYPTVRLFRQDERREWLPVLDKVKAELLRTLQTQ